MFGGTCGTCARASTFSKQGHSIANIPPGLMTRAHSRSTLVKLVYVYGELCRSWRSLLRSYWSMAAPSVTKSRGALSGAHGDQPALFSGDTLFCGGPGATGRSYSDEPTILRSIRDRLLVLPDETIVHTGHGDSTTIGAERERVLARAVEVGL